MGRSHYNKNNTFAITIDLVVQRYNESVSDIAEYNGLVLAYNNTRADQKLRQAGESMSQALEFALKLHCKEHSPKQYCYLTKAPVPRIIEECYWDGKQMIGCAEETISGEKSDVNFEFLSSNKFDLTNGAKHQGKEVELNTVKGYVKEVGKFILQYLDADADLKNEEYYNRPEYNTVQQFYTACEKFRKDERRFILLVDKNNSNRAVYRNFNRVNWDVIFEFNSRSLEEGFYQVAYNGKAPTHIYTTDDRITKDSIPTSSDSPLLYFANGYGAVKCAPDAKRWFKDNNSRVENFVRTYASVTLAQEFVVVSIMKDKDLLLQMMDILSKQLDNAKFVVANDPDGSFLSLCNEYRYADVEHVAISLTDIDKCLNEYLLSPQMARQEDVFKLPCLQKEVDGILTKREMTDLEEYFEVLYEGIDEGTDDVMNDFLSGNSPLSWEGAKRSFAAERSKARSLYYKTVDEVVRKGRGKLMIVHEPGFGGTTVARQIAYHYHADYPVLVMKRYKNFATIKNLLGIVHNKTKKTVIVLMEVPTVISQDEMDALYNNTNLTRPYLFIGVKRGSNKSSSKKLVVSDWGNDVVLLRDKFMPYIQQFPEYIRKEKEAEIARILSGDDEDLYKRTPFYFGFLAFEQQFAAMTGFLEQFVNTVKDNPMQKKALVYITMVDFFINNSVPDSFLRTVFNVSADSRIFHLEDYFSEDDGIVTSLLTTENKNGMIHRRLKYPYFALQLLKMLLGSNENEGSKVLSNFGSYCKSFIEDVAANSNAKVLQDYLLRDLFIGSSSERMGQSFTKVFDYIQPEEKVNIFLLLHAQFPENPHFASHLARYYAIVERNNSEALRLADEAICLSEYDDPLLHHIKGMCLLSMISDKTKSILDRKKLGMEADEEEVDRIFEDWFPEAQEEFKTAREIKAEQKHKDEYGYIPCIQLILNVFDFAVKLKGLSKIDVVSKAMSPYFEWLENAQALLAEAKNLYLEGEESERYAEIETKVWDEYGSLGELVGNLRNKLDRKEGNQTIIRRQMARIYLRKSDSYKTNMKDCSRILEMMEENIMLEPKNESNFYLWFAAARYSKYSNDEIIARVTQWYNLNPSMDILFYCYVFNVNKAVLEGSTEAAKTALNYEKNCKKFGTDDVRVREWFGGTSQHIITNKAYKENPAAIPLDEVTGIVKEYIHPGAAKILLDCGLTVFFRPSENGLTDSCLNHKVQFSFGFSYDGLRALDGSVKVID